MLSTNKQFVSDLHKDIHSIPVQKVQPVGFIRRKKGPRDERHAAYDILKPYSLFRESNPGSVTPAKPFTLLNDVTRICIALRNAY